MIIRKQCVEYIKNTCTKKSQLDLEIRFGQGTETQPLSLRQSMQHCTVSIYCKVNIAELLILLINISLEAKQRVFIHSTSGTQKLIGYIW